MRTHKIKNFINQLFLTPVSFIINVLAIGPIVLFFSGFVADIGLISLFVIIIMYAIAFAFNKALFRAKGKKVDEGFYVTYLGVDVDIEIDYEKRDWKIKSAKPYTYDKYETSLTMLGWIASILCFIAFPLRLIALLMSYIALFVPQIYSTPQKLSEETEGVLSVFSEFTHTFFDFIIVPIKKHTDKERNIKGLIFVPIYIVSFLVTHILLLFVYTMLNWYRTPDFIEIFLILSIVFSVISSLILVIKYCLSICFDYSKNNAIKCLIKIVALPIILIVIILIVNFIPFTE